MNERIKANAKQAPTSALYISCMKYQLLKFIFWRDDIFAYNVLSLHYPRVKPLRFLS